jgi:hypothetical protein
MSILDYVNELKNVNIEIKRLNQQATKLRKRAKEVEQNIIEFLKEKNQPGVKFQDTAIVVENKSKWVRKGKKDIEEDSLKILEDNGIDDPKYVLEKILMARKGEELEQSKIKIKKIKS